MRKAFFVLRTATIYLLVLFCAGLSRAQSEKTSDASEWIPLFDGQSLEGWKAGEHSNSFKVVAGQIACDGPRSHLFYVGKGRKADFKNFELKAEVLSRPGANSGLYFHTAFQEAGWPDQGFEVQINNTHRGEGDYREFKKTGSLYGVRNQYKSIVQDNEWFNVHIVVQGKRVRIQVNGTLLVDYVEPASPVQHQEGPGRVLARGTFALQCHDEGSKVFFKNIMVKPLPDDSVAEPMEQPVVDAKYAQIFQMHAENFPIVNLHVHLKGGLTLEQALASSRKTGVNYGIAVNCGLGFSVTNDAGILQFLNSMQGRPVFIGMQAEGREWVRLFSKEAIARFDYVFTDAMTFTDDAGKRTRLWIKEEVAVHDKQAFMDMLVDRIVAILSHEPVDIYVNPTFLPECIAQEYDALWTKERMRKVIEAAAKKGVAIEINARYRIPSPAFIKMAKSAGIKFSFGTNNADQNIGDLDYCLAMVKECGLASQDMFLPKPDLHKTFR